MSNDGKFLNLSGGLPTQESAINASAGAADAGKIPKLDPSGKLDLTMIPSSISPETRTLPASEALAAGDLINIWSAAGTVKMRKADATTPGKEAHGFVLTAVANGAVGTVYPEENVVTGLAGLTPGATQFLSTTAGARTEAAPSGTGNVAQAVGVALSATEMLFRPRQSITLA